MTLSIERFREQLVDYLYGELEGESLREFEAALRTSEPCRRELEAMKATLRISREGAAALRALDEAPPARVSSAVLAAAAARAGELVAEPSPGAAARPGAASSVWSWLRTPWLLPTLGVAAAVSIVVLHKRVESPKVPGYESASEQRAEQPSTSSSVPAAPAPADSYPPSAQPAVARTSPRSGEGQAGPAAAAAGGSAAAAPAKVGARAERPHAQETPRARATSASDRLSAERADEAPGASLGALADDQGAASVRAPAAEPSASTGYAEPPPAWTGRTREEAKKEASATRPRGAPSEELEAAPEQDQAIGGAIASRPDRARAGPAPAAKSAARTLPAASEPARAPAPGATASAPRVPVADARPGAAADVATRAPDESVKRALEHMTARRFGPAAVAYRELLSRYPKDPRAPEWRKQLTAAMQALSKVDTVR